MYGYIYKTTCLTNNKIYIGQKKSNKYLGNKYLGSGKILKNAISKYGEDNFVTELICECDSFDELNEKEIYYIDKFNSTDESIGYNILQGGQGFKGFDNGYHLGMLGKHQTEKQKQAMRDYNKNKIISDETRLKMSLAKIGKPHKSTTKGLKAVHKDNKQLFVKVNDLEKYIKNGYSLGYRKKNKFDFSEYYKNGEYMHKVIDLNNIDVKFVKPDRFEEMLNIGYDFGKKPRNECSSNKFKDYSLLKSQFLKNEF